MSQNEKVCQNNLSKAEGEAAGTIAATPATVPSASGTSLEAAPAVAQQESTPQRLTGPPLLRLENVTVRFGAQNVLQDVSLEIPQGQSLAVMGESGCGKTVFLKVLIGLIRPTSGRVLLDGVDVHRLSEAEWMRQRLRFGFVFQSAALFDSMSVYENVAFPLRQHTDWDEATIRHRVRQQLAEIGLGEEVLAKYPAELSGGMRKRVGLARALMLKPQIMLYDEPTTGLDPIMADVINSLIRQTHERHGITSVVVTHDLNTVRRVAQRVVMLYPHRRLKPGEAQIIFDGMLSDLDNTPDLRVRQFVLGQAGELLHVRD
ncbi:MAG: ABC transporter ATP-binding protein [Gemmatales bacterium]|nr:ABC transporter ATP-binding protein [Gemmatales bacterium]MDW8175722.1 ABC transporter ATP-binding protein [Gemmatales bacterium]